MKPLSSLELARYDWVQLVTMIRSIETMLPDLAEGSDERRNALINLYMIRRALSLRASRER